MCFLPRHLVISSRDLHISSSHKSPTRWRSRRFLGQAQHPVGRRGVGMGSDPPSFPNRCRLFSSPKKTSTGWLRGWARGATKNDVCIHVDVCTYQNWPTSSYFWRSSFLKVSFLQGWFTSKVLEKRCFFVRLAENGPLKSYPTHPSFYCSMMNFCPKVSRGGTSSNVRRPPPTH